MLYAHRWLLSESSVTTSVTVEDPVQALINARTCVNYVAALPAAFPPFQHSDLINVWMMHSGELFLLVAVIFLRLS